MRSIKKPKSQQRPPADLSFDCQIGSVCVTEGLHTANDSFFLQCSVVCVWLSRHEELRQVVDGQVVVVAVALRLRRAPATLRVCQLGDAFLRKR